MNWSNVKLILVREVRDQLRDRRTLFMIAVLPILLYPLLGMSMFQVLQFVREHATKVLLVGAKGLPSDPPLVNGRYFDQAWFIDADHSKLLEVTLDNGNAPVSEEKIRSYAGELVQKGDYEAVVYFPPDFAARLAAFQRDLARTSAKPPALNDGPISSGHRDPTVPGPQVFYNTAKEKSQITYVRLSQVIDRWTEEIGRRNLATSRLPETAAHPFKLATHDVADKGHQDAAVWSKLLPFMVLIWALTGAFYPAIDLCAGEKERGTLETLLSSPAQRSEIVWGKLLTVMLFSFVTAVLNLMSIGVTGMLVMSILPSLGPPPLLTPLWLLVALLPMSALFSALCLALAAFAKSTKEGQYYLMPLMLVTMPLVMLPMAPGVELNVGNSLIPVTGVMLLMRTLLEGNYAEALPYVPLVAGVTLTCCWWAIRWAEDQFNSESVLFRESERLDVGLWLRHMLRDRGDTPGAAQAVLCGVLILMVQFFMNFAVHQPNSFADLAMLAVVTQLAVVATPALLMTIMLTRSPRQTLLLRQPRWLALPAAAMLALVVHPAVHKLTEAVQRLYPMRGEVYESLERLVSETPSLWQLLLVMAVLPAICEELAFRGFILSGLRHTGHKWRAIALSSIFFGITHGVIQQSIVASIVGMLIGYIAVQSSSLLPGIVFHVTHNSLFLLASQARQPGGPDSPFAWMDRIVEGGVLYEWSVVVAGLATAAVLVVWFRSLPYSPTAEESLQDAIEHQASRAAAS